MVALSVMAVPAAVGWGVAGATTETATLGTPEPPEPAEPDQPTVPEPVFPRPGGGPRVIHTYVSLFGPPTYVLDVARGVYRRLPYVNLRISPNGRAVAVEGPDGRIGVAERRALLRDGEAAIRWTGLPPGSPSWWSPDGRALLVTTLDKDTRRFAAHRYDVGSGRLRQTPIGLDCDICTVGWAADSVRYTVMLRGGDPSVPSGPVQYLNPDGTPGRMLGATGMIWNADSYSRTRRYVIVEPPRPFDAAEPTGWQLPTIVDLWSRRVVATIRTGSPVLGWYDDRHVVTVAPTIAGEPAALEVVDVRTGAVTARLPVPGLMPDAALIQIGSSGGLRGEAAELGF